MLRFFSIICLIWMNAHMVFPHSGWKAHADDMFAVFGFQEHAGLRDWMKFISSDMIDQYNKDGFYSRLKSKHHWFACDHRLLFHWGYNTKPWNDALEQKVIKYAKGHSLDGDSIKKALQQDLIQEQKKRNRLMNARTEKLFGFAHGGKDAGYANFFVSMAYNVHLIGDYTSDNTELDGVREFSSLMAGIIADIQRLDKRRSKSVIKDLKAIQQGVVGEQKRADVVLAFLKQRLPRFIQEAENGSIKRRLEKKGFLFTK